MPIITSGWCPPGGGAGTARSDGAADAAVPGLLPPLATAGVDGDDFVVRYQHSGSTLHRTAMAGRGDGKSRGRPRSGKQRGGVGGGDGGDGSAGAVAVVVRPDGSATAKWPNGSIAVSVDREGDGGYRLYAAFRVSGSVAASFDSSGNGYANLATTGSTCLSVNAERGGFSLGPDGAISRRRDCHSAAPPSTFSRCFNRNKKGVPSK